MSIEEWTRDSGGFNMNFKENPLEETPKDALDAAREFVEKMDEPN